MNELHISTPPAGGNRGCIRHLKSGQGRIFVCRIYTPMMAVRLSLHQRGATCIKSTLPADTSANSSMSSMPTRPAGGSRMHPFPTGQGEIFYLVLRVRPMIGIRVIIITAIVVKLTQIVIVIVIVHSHSPTGETYRNNNIVANTAKAVKGICHKKKKVNGKLTPKKIKSNFILPSIKTW